MHVRVLPGGLFVPRHRHLSLAAPWHGAQRQGSSSSRLEASPDQELAVARARLSEAQDEVELLMAQVASVEALQQRMAEQDETVLRLQQYLSASQVREENRLASSERVKELEATLNSMAQALPPDDGDDMEQKEQWEHHSDEYNKAAAEVAAIGKKLAETDEEIERERQRVLAAEQRLLELERAAQEAQAQARDASSRLAKQQREAEALEAELSSRVAGAGKAGGRGFGGKKGKRSPANDGLQQLLDQTTSLRQAVEQAKVDLDELRSEGQQQEEEATSAEASLQKLSSSYQDQAVQLYTASAEVSQLEEQLSQLRLQQQQQEEALAAAQSAAEALSLERAASFESRRDSLYVQLVTSRAVLAAMHEDTERFQKQLEQLQLKADDLKAQKEALCAETLEAQAQVEVLREDLQESRQHPLDVLQEQLQEVSVGMDEVYGLRGDLQVLAEAFQDKETEAVRLRAAAQAASERQEAASLELKEAQAQEAEVKQTLEQVLQQVAQLKAAVVDLQYSNNKLSLQNHELQACIRAQDRVTRTVEGKTAEMESSLVGFSDKVVTLRAQLEMKTQALSEANQRLTFAQEAEGSARAAADMLAVQVEAQRKSNLLKAGEVEMLSKELQFSRAEVAKLRRAEVSLGATSAAVLQGRADTQELERLTHVAEAEREQLQSELERSMEQVNEMQQQVQASEEQRFAELSVARETAATLQQELEALQVEIARYHHLTQQKANLVQARSQMAKLKTDLEEKEQLLRNAVEQRDRMQAELELLAVQVESISEELSASRAQGVARGHEAEASALQTEATKAAVSELRLELTSEAQRTQELLAQAERLLLTSPGDAGKNSTPEETAAAGSDEDVDGSSETETGAPSDVDDAGESDSEQAEAQRITELKRASVTLQTTFKKLQEQLSQQQSGVSTRDVIVAENQAAAVQAEAAALLERVKQLEELGRLKEREVQDLLQIAQSKNLTEQIQSLSEKVEATKEENQNLKQLTRRQENMLKQTRQFLQGRVAPSDHLN